MKKTLERIFILVLACALSFSVLACGSKKDDTNKKDTDATNQTEQAGVDFSKYPNDFNVWKMADMKDYLKDSGVFTEEAWLIPISGGELTAMQVTEGLGYIDTAKMSTCDIIFYFDANTTDENIKKQFENTKAKHVLSVQGNDMPLDTMVGHFAFQYVKTVDEVHKEALKKAIDDLAAHFNVTTEF